MRLTAARVEGVVKEALIAYLDTVDLARVAAGKSGTEGEALAAELAKIERLKTAVFAAAEEGLIDVAEQRRRLLPVRRREEAARQRLASQRSTSGALMPYAGRRGALRRLWPEMTETERREVTRAAFGTVAIMPTERRGCQAFDASRVRLAPAPL